MNMEQIKLLVFALADIVAIIWALIIKPKIDAELDEKQKDELTEWIIVGVNAAEMIMNTEKGAEKKKFVMEFVKDKLSNLTRLDITDDVLSIIVESFVKELKYPTAR